MMRLPLVTVMTLSLGACATSFHGDAKFPGGPTACFDRCAEAGMEMRSFVFVGEYSTGCVCGLKRKRGASAQQQDREGDDGTAASTAAAVGVVLQMRAAAAQAAAQQSAMNAAMMH